MAKALRNTSLECSTRNHGLLGQK